MNKSNIQKVCKSTTKKDGKGGGKQKETSSSIFCSASTSETSLQETKNHINQDSSFNKFHIISTKDSLFPLLSV
jgi:hypothetical protein